MASLMLIMSVWTCVYALLSSILTIADDNYPPTLLKLVGRSHTLAVIVYVLTLIAAAISLWEAWKATVGSVGSFSA